MGNGTNINWVRLTLHSYLAKLLNEVYLAKRQEKVMCCSLKFRAKAGAMSQSLQNCIAIARVSEVAQSGIRLATRGTEHLPSIGTAVCLRHGLPRNLALLPRTRLNIPSQLQRKPPSFSVR